MVTVTATRVPGQEDVRTIVSVQSNNEPHPEWEHTPPSSVPLVVEVLDPGWRPTSCRNIPGASTFAMPKGEAVALALSLNRHEMTEQLARHAANRQTLWSLVVLHKNGFCVARIQVRDWRPESVFDLPPDAWPLAAPSEAVRCAAKEFNRRQMANGQPQFWCLPVKRIVPSVAAMEGGAA